MNYFIVKKGKVINENVILMNMLLIVDLYMYVQSKRYIMLMYNKLYPKNFK